MITVTIRADTYQEPLGSYPDPRQARRAVAHHIINELPDLETVLRQRGLRDLAQPLLRALRRAYLQHRYRDVERLQRQAQRLLPHDERLYYRRRRA